MSVSYAKAEYAKVEVTGDETENGFSLPTAIPMLSVVAPANLPEGYTFQAKVESGKIFTVVVPPGGVEEGQSFTVPCDSPSEDPNTFSIPVGAWKDPLCNCCAYGCCHPHLCLTFWCHSLSLAQVMVRMRLNWLGGHTSISGVAGTYKIMLFLTALYWSLYAIINMTYNYIVATALLTPTEEVNPQFTDDGSMIPYPPPASAVLLHNIMTVLNVAYWVYVIVLLIRTRMAIRSKYAIPTQCCHGCCEDVVCAICCGGCTIMQMMRHTANYEKYAGQCCTETGLSPHVHNNDSIQLGTTGSRIV